MCKVMTACAVGVHIDKTGADEIACIIVGFLAGNILCGDIYDLTVFQIDIAVKQLFANDNFITFNLNHIYPFNLLNLILMVCFFLETARSLKCAIPSSLPIFAQRVSLERICFRSFTSPSTLVTLEAIYFLPP